GSAGRRGRSATSRAGGRPGSAGSGRHVPDTLHSRSQRWSRTRNDDVAPAGVSSPCSATEPTYDPGMSDRKTRLTVTVDPHLAAYAEQLVDAGKAPSVSAVFNDALAERVERDKRIRRRWKEAAERADPEKVDRMIAHVQAKAAVLPGR